MITLREDQQERIERNRKHQLYRQMLDEQIHYKNYEQSRQQAKTTPHRYQQQESYSPTNWPSN